MSEMAQNVQTAHEVLSEKVRTALLCSSELDMRAEIQDLYGFQAVRDNRKKRNSTRVGATRGQSDGADEERGSKRHKDSELGHEAVMCE